MIDVQQSDEFQRWLRALRDEKAKSIIQLRLDRVGQGNLGDAKVVGDGVGELRIHYGPGYRLYFTREGDRVIVLLCGGEKSDQPRDIERARRLAREWRT